jgi:hypothetical protein
MVIDLISHHYAELQTAIRHTRHSLFSNRQIAIASESKIVILCQGKKEKKMKKRMNYPE